jgi:hypothetical protein
MAGFTADLNPKQTGMSLGDMMKMGLYSAEADVLNRQAAIAREKEKEIPIIQNFAKDQNTKLPDGSFDLKQLPSLVSMAPLSGPDFARNIIDLTKNHIETNRALNSLSEENRKPFASIYGNFGQLAANGQQVTAPQIIGSLERLKDFYPQLAQAADGQIKGLKAFGNAPISPQELLKYRNETMSPRELIDQFAPKATTGTVGGQTVGVITQPSVVGETPRVSTTPLGGGEPMQPTGGAPTETKPMPKLIQEDTSMNYTGPANPLNLGDIRQKLYDTGIKNIETVNASKPIIANMQQSVRKVEDYINSAAGSKLGQMVRQGTKFVFSDPELDMAVKNLANLQARSSAIMGLNSTDSSRELNAKLSGSVDIAPEALAGVMQQVKAEAKAAELYTQGVNKFVEKRGDINGYIQEQKFQRKWAEHYDPRIFQVDDIAGSKLPEAEKVKEIGQITGRMTKPEFEKYKEDRQIINRLAKGLYQ